MSDNSSKWEFMCTFSFACPKEKDAKKKGPRLCPSGYSGQCRRAMRHQAVLCRDVAYRVSQAERPAAQRRMAAPKRRGVKQRARFCVKNGRLFERSELTAV